MFNLKRFIFSSLFLLVLLSGTYSQRSYLDTIKTKTLSDKQLVSCYNRLSVDYSTIDNDSSVMFARKAYNLSTMINYWKGIAASLMNIGNYYETEGYKDKAIEQYLRGISLANTYKDTFYLILFIRETGIANRYKSDYYNALSCLLTSMNLAETFKNDSLIILSHCSLGNFYTNFQDQDLAKKHYGEALATAFKSKLLKSYIDMQISYGSVLRMAAKKNDSIMVYYNSAAILAKYYKLRKYEINAYQQMSEYFDQMHQYDTAIEYAKKAYQIVHRTENIFSQAIIATRLGHLYGLKGDYNKELSLQKEAYQLRKKGNFKFFEASSLINIGSTYANLGQYDQAIASINQGLSYFQKLNNIKYLLNAYKKLYESYFAKRDYKSAYVNLKSYNDCFEKYQILSDGGKVFKIQSKYDNALNLIKIDKQELHNVKLLRNLSNLLLALSAIIIVLVSTLFIIRTKNRNKLLKLNSQLEMKVAERTKQITEEIRLKEFTKKTVDFASEAIFWIKSDGSLNYGNDKACIRFGYTPDELLGLKIWEIDKNLKKDKWDLMWRNLLLNKYILIETNYYTKERKLVPVEISVNYLKDRNVEFMIVYVRDITDRKEREKELNNYKNHLEELVETRTKDLLQSEDKYSMLIDSAYESIIIAQDGLVKFVNPATLSLLDLNSKQEIIDVPFPEFIHPDDRDLVIENYRRRIAGKTVPTRYDFRVVGKHGSEKWVEINGASIEWQGKPATLNFLTDITDRKKSELLLSQQLFFTNALNKIAEIIIIKDNPGNILESVNSIIGSTLKLDRSLIYYVSFEKNNIKGLCEWSKPDNPEILSINEEYTSLEMFLYPATEIKKSQKYLESHVGKVNEYFNKDRSGHILHNELNIKSLLWYPFAFDDHGYYLFTLYQIIKQRTWTQEELDFLESVANQVNLALIKIKFLEERKLTEEQLIETKERSLISQMKPHFIFNTLTAIQSYIYSNSPREANQYISSFASLMRIYLTNSQNEFISVKEEITTIKYYLELQKLRYQDKFDYSVSFDNEEELAFVTIPPMLTQPLVENAIEHGIQNKGTKGFVSLSFSLSDNYIVFIVEDDGPGVEYTKNLKKSDKHLSVSTSIINERLKWLNKKYSQKIIYEICDIIKDGEVAGTLAKMSIPYTD